ncbi:MAG TPA: DUF255 domain-containing protein [Candidatus Latescibacteria bacterium]|nr:DUF255 domain-containing protein [Candidatus Handelsmanbacteria bacterium]HIL11805.1 DUF255 domain-containing protein [Candidatus Latescibacterota bacterium]
MVNFPATSLRFWLGVVCVLVIGLGATWGWLRLVGEQELGAVAAAELEVGHGLKNADGSWKYSNKLVGETSPYLLLHAHNPVDWYPWGEEALARAKAEDKPIFLSVGYSTCYWCHVMERLVFSDPQIAALMNEDFINIKVDREERPDIDRIYMKATQLITQHGGWPNSVFLTPDLQPFFAGTYFPPEDAHGRPSFPRVLGIMQQHWRDERGKVLEIAAELTAAIREMESGREMVAMAPDSVLVVRVLAAIQGRYDAINGGFGGAPKFPPGMRLELLMADVERFEKGAAPQIVLHTLAQMARGGIYDQMGGGFHRYSTDAEWQVPHFEKMLYNQAQLVRLYLRAYELTEEPRWRFVAQDIFRFVAREMTAPDGAFYSALDAETEAEEGKYYVWTEEELAAVLGEDAELFWTVYGLAPMPEGEGQVLFVETSWAAAAVELELDEEQLRRRIEPLRQRLLAARSKRIYPLLDDKVLTAWNGLMIEAYARGFEVLGEAEYRRAAERAADFVLQRLRREDGGLSRVHRLGASQHRGYLNDYAFLMRGLTVLHRATGEQRWLQAAQELSGEMVARFWDQEAGGLFFAEAGGELIVRSKGAQDSALPSGNAVAAHALLDLAELTGEVRYRNRAAQILHAFGGGMRAQPSASVHLAAAAERYLRSASVRVSLPAVAEAVMVDSLVGIRVELPTSPLIAGETFAVTVHLTVREGWHINANPPSGDSLIPTSLTVNADLPLGFGGVRYPAGQDYIFPALAETLSVYEGEVTLWADLLLPEKAAGTAGDLRLLVQYQACDDARCLPPAELSRSVRLVVAE